MPNHNSTTLKLPVVFDPIYSQLDLPKRHRFPIEKYQSLFDRAFNDYGELLIHHPVPGYVSRDTLLKVHDPLYIDEFTSGQLCAKKMKRIGFDWSQQFVNRTLTAVNGTLTTAKLAAEIGVAINCTGGYHHSHPDFGSGFCVFNDLMLAACELLDNSEVSRVLIFDCDVHQGDGTAVCGQPRGDVFTVSIHCEKNFPTRKQDSDWDIGLDRHISDSEYLPVVEETLIAAIESFKPDFIIYDAGVDIHQDDDLGLLNITTNGIYLRDKMVFQQAKQRQIPVMAVIGGGYQRDIDKLTDVHIQLIKSASDVFILHND